MKVGLLRKGPISPACCLRQCCPSQSPTQEFMSSEVSSLFLLKKTLLAKACQAVSKEMNQGIKSGRSLRAGFAHKTKEAFVRWQSICKGNSLCSPRAILAETRRSVSNTGICMAIFFARKYLPHSLTLSVPKLGLAVTIILWH